MSYVYNRAFNIGVAVNLIAFALANLIAYWIAYRAYYETSPGRRISFSGGGDLFSWGFPFYLADSPGGVLNILIIALISFVLGSTFRLLLGKRKALTSQ